MIIHLFEQQPFTEATVKAFHHTVGSRGVEFDQAVIDITIFTKIIGALDETRTGLFGYKNRRHASINASPNFAP